MAILGSRSPSVWFLRQEDKGKEFGRIWGQRGGKMAGGTRAIGRGICVLLGISLEDTQKELEHMVRKILNLRVFEDESGKHWSKSVMDKQYEVLCVSQFTLQCVLKGNKPDFHLAMPAEQAESFYKGFLEQLRKAYRPELIKDGKFGAYMQVHIQNDGPVTIELESPAPGAAASDPKQQSNLRNQHSHCLAAPRPMTRILRGGVRGGSGLQP
ncbi:hypothetical protein FD755_005151 [Muntiacus reevesi]|uniref:D-aminoacyl-tRNA deacylase n=1 Tax=Muntiacus reevesi TaxID=9886 RepID=A0A5J5MSN1_MUNRE|nr:hypothetical protein FD755_005151 [Muntiacus reevesi]